MIKRFAMYRCSVELSVRYDELSQSEREHASFIDEYTRLILWQTGSICVLIWTLDLLDWYTRLNLQFDVLDLNTGLALVVKTLPDGTFSSIWVNRDGIRTLFRFVNTLVQFCGEHACSVSRRLQNRRETEQACLGHWICSCLSFSIPQYSNYKF